MNNKVLYISYDGMTDSLGQSQVIPYLKGLAGKGYSITILSTEKKINFNDNKNNIKSILNSSGILWIPLIYTKNPPIVSTFLDILKLSVTAKRLHKKNNYSIVHCRSYIAAFVGLYMKQKYNVRFIFDMRAFYADERVDGGLWNLKNPVFNWIYRYFKRKEIEFLKAADYSVSLTNTAKEIILEWDILKNNKPQIEVIPCCADLNLFSSKNIKTEDQTNLRKELQISENDFVVSYLGSLGTWYMADEMMKFFKCLSQKKNNAKFLLITPDDRNSVLKYSDKFSIPESCIVTKKVDRNFVPLHLSISNISLFFITPLFSKKGSSPTKLAEILGMGIPVICNSGVGDMELYFKNHRIGHLMNSFSENDYQIAINSIDTILSIPKPELVNAATELFSLEKGVEKYSEIYRKILE